MRHLHFTQSLEPLQGGGLGRAALDLHLQLLQDGFASKLISTRSANFDPVWPATDQYVRQGPPMLYYARHLRTGSAQSIAQADVIHGHGFYVYPNWAIGGLARGYHKPLVYHPHGMFDPWILGRSRWKKRPVHFLFENRNMRECRLWRALTNKEADQIRGLGFKAPIVVAPNGVRLEDYDVVPPPGTPPQLKLPERVRNKRCLAFMARLHPKKGLSLLLPAWAGLAERHKDWELVIAGPDEGGYLATVKSLIRELGLESSTTLTGTVTGGAKLELLRMADLFILPSFSEGLPVTVLEAMACRVPVIATLESNLPELETEGGGWLCHAEVDSVQWTLSRALAASETERKSRGQTARALVERRYTWPAIAATIRDGC
jgi:glycosyltransferase involved in cell wall biosynthesis